MGDVNANFFLFFKKKEIKLIGTSHWCNQALSFDFDKFGSGIHQDTAGQFCVRKFHVETVGESD